MSFSLRLQKLRYSYTNKYDHRKYSTSLIIPIDRVSMVYIVLSSIFMSLLFSVSLIAVMYMQEFTNKWLNDLQGYSTVMVSPSEQEVSDEGDEISIEILQDMVISGLSSVPGVLGVQIVEQEKILEILTPWFGNDDYLVDVSLPVLFEVEYAPESSLDFSYLTERLDALGIVASAFDKEYFFRDLQPVYRTFIMLAAIFLLISLSCSAITVALACRVGIALRADVISMLSLLGATRHFIVGIFVKRCWISATVGSVVGVVIVITCIMSGFWRVLIRSWSDEMGVESALMHESLVYLAIVPVLFGIISLLFSSTYVSSLLKQGRHV